MDAEHPQVRPSHPRIPRITSSFWRKLGLRILIFGVVMIAVGRSMYDGGLFVHPSIHHQLSCASSRQCVVTIQHAGGGFYHDFNPAYSWAVTGEPAAYLHFSPTSGGTLQANQSVQVQVLIAPGSCPNSITITSKMGIANFNPFVSDPLTGQCSVHAPVSFTVSTRV